MAYSDDLISAKQAVAIGDYEQAALLIDRLRNSLGYASLNDALYWVYRVQDAVEGTLCYTRLQLACASTWLAFALYLLLHNQITALISKSGYSIGFYILLCLGFLSIVVCVIRRLYEKASIDGLAARAIQAVNVCMTTNVVE